MAKYLLSGSSEAKRLDDQSNLENYSIASEIGHINLNRYNSILDAGCGSGVLCRYLESREVNGLQGCDLSLESLTHAKDSSLSKTTNYFQHNIFKAPTIEKYDLIFNRFVAHHFSEVRYKAVVKNLFNSLDAGGELLVIDLDGYFCNLIGLDGHLDKSLKKLLTSFHGDLNMGRKIPKILKEVGFQNVSWEIQTMDFQGEQKELEIEQVKSRYDNSLDFYIDIFGTEFEAKKFQNDLLKIMQSNTSPIFYNKFIVKGTKA